MEIKKFDRETYKKIDRYLRDQMTDEEVVDFEIKMSLDKELEEAVKLRRLMIESLIHKRKEELKNFIRRNSSMRYSGNIWGTKFTRFSAALIIVTGIILLVSDPESPEHSPTRDQYPATDPIEEEDTLNN